MSRKLAIGEVGNHTFRLNLRHGQMFPSTGKKVATSHRMSSYPLLSVHPVERLPRSHDLAENVPSGLAISRSAAKTTSNLRHSCCFTFACLAEPTANFVAAASLTIDGGFLTGLAIGYAADRDMLKYLIIRRTSDE